MLRFAALQLYPFFFKLCKPLRKKDGMEKAVRNVWIPKEVMLYMIEGKRRGCPGGRRVDGAK